MRTARRPFAASRFTTTILFTTSWRSPFAIARTSAFAITGRAIIGRAVTGGPIAARWTVGASFSVTSRTAFRAWGSDFIVGQLTVTVFIERLQSGRRIVDLFFGDLSVMIFVQCIHDRMWRTRSIVRTAFTARRWTIGAAFTSWWLCQNIHRDSDAQQCHDSTC